MSGLPSNLAPEAPGEVLSTMEKDGSRRWMKPIPAFGQWWKRRAVIGWFLIVAYIALPIVQINGKPGIWLNVIGREFTILGRTFEAYDTLALVLFLLSIFLLIFLATSLLGRAWCGWACPQTVYLEFVFRPIEQWLEGPRGQKLKRLSKGAQAARKGLKFALYTVIALVLAHTFVAYFVSWEALLQWMLRPPGENTGFFIIMLATTALVLLDFAFFREQMCTVACPYARFQSVLLDRNSLIVSYDPGRGEPRGKRSRKLRQKEEEGFSIELGDCIDCGACVRTCPTGIDIRDGLQMECVGCTQCIDACDDIMDQVKKPRGLIRFTSENELDGDRTRVLRPRVLLYTALVTIAVAALATVIATQSPLDLTISRASSEPFTTLQDGSVANRLAFRLHNRSAGNVTVRLEAIEPPGARLQVLGGENVALEPGQMRRVEAWIILPETHARSGQVDGLFRATWNGDTDQTATFPLLTPTAP